MRNISFDNPYLLLILIPILACIIIPLAIAIRKENRSKSVVASAVLHIVIALCIALALGGMIFTTVMTETQVYVVADVSFSGKHNLDQVDAYIKQLQDSLPRNSKLGIVVFGKEAKVLSEIGEKELLSVKEHGFETSQIESTDITAALNYTAGLFDDDVIKRVVLITDGQQTRTEATGELIGAVENLYANSIYIDAIFMDNTLPEDWKEVQISDIEYVDTTYKGHKATASILVQSTYDTNEAYLTFRVDGVKFRDVSVKLNKGYNVINFELPTAEEGKYSYRFTINAEENAYEDGTINSRNNSYEFTQTVVEHLNVLAISGDAADEARLGQMYAEGTKIQFLLQKGSQKLDVPCTVDELCAYDEIVISNIDIRDLNNVTAFVDALDTVVSRFGKSLVTLGDLRIQNKTDTNLTKLENLLPVKYGNNSQEPKLYVICLDVSRSMQNFSRLRIAKAAAKQLINSLAEDDYAMIIQFWGDVTTSSAPMKVGTNRQAMLDNIDEADPQQGTMLTDALLFAERYMTDENLPFSEKQIMLISDGMSWVNTATEADTPVEVAKRMYEDHNISTSVIQPAGRLDDLDITDPDTEPNGNPALLTELAASAGGKYYAIYREADLLEVMFTQVLDDMTESVVTGDNLKVHIKIDRDDVLAGLTTVPNVQGYANSKAKASANTVLTVDYTRASGTVVEVPLYAYWKYGNGKVSTFTSTLTGEWSRDWQGEAGDQFFGNVAAENIPTERVDRPYSLDVQFDGAYSQVDLVPVVLNPKATATVTITLPNGTTATEKLIFDSSRYYYRFETPATGSYTLDVVYEYDGKQYASQSVYTISYSPEYNLFESFDPSTLHAAIRNRGTVVESGIPSLENDEKEVTTYMLPLIVPLMVLAVVLYVIDIIIRKLKISDIKSFFGIKPKKGARS